MLWSHVPIIPVSDTSHIPQNDVGNHVGLDVIAWSLETGWLQEGQNRYASRTKQIPMLFPRSVSQDHALQTLEPKCLDIYIYVCVYTYIHMYLCTLNVYTYMYIDYVVYMYTSICI